MDVGDLPNHVKYCVSVFYPPLSNYQNTPGPSMGVPEIPQHASLYIVSLPRQEKTENKIIDITEQHKTYYKKP